MIDTQDKKDEVKQKTAEAQEETKNVDAAEKNASYKAEPKRAE